MDETVNSPATPPVITLRELAHELLPPLVKRRVYRHYSLSRLSETPRLASLTGLYQHKAQIVELIETLWRMVESGHLQRPPAIAGTVAAAPAAVAAAAVDLGAVPIIRPPDPILEWMRIMIAPLPKRPIITISDAARIFGIRLGVLQEDMKRLGIAATDSHFGRLLTLDNLVELNEVRRLGGNRQPLDRLHLLLWLCGMSFWDVDRRKVAIAAYSAQVEEEIARIARLKGTAKTMAAVELLRRYADVATIAEGIHGMSGVGEVVERHLGRLAQAAFGKDGKRVLERVMNSGIDNSATP